MIRTKGFIFLGLSLLLATSAWAQWPNYPTRGVPKKDGIFEIGAGIPGGPPYTPWAADVKKKRASENGKDNPDAHCLPIGLMQLHLHPQPRKIIQTPDEKKVFAGSSAENEISQ